VFGGGYVVVVDVLAKCDVVYGVVVVVISIAAVRWFVVLCMRGT